MLFTQPPATLDDIRRFCSTFDEGIRVEYKSSFDGSVRNKLPKIVSSFANSLGGVLIVGVDTQNGIPREPIDGFLRPEREELRLVVESLCLSGINPPILPRITEVPGQCDERVVLVVEVDESWEAPHAIENTTRVYVRTGNASNPYQLAEVDLIIELVRRRDEPMRRRDRIVAQAREKARMFIGDDQWYADMIVGPMYPRRPICLRENVRDFLGSTRYRGGHYYPFETLKRIDEGAAFVSSDAYLEVGKHGIVFGRNLLQDGSGLSEVFHQMVKVLVCSSNFYRQTSYRGSVLVQQELHNNVGHNFGFMPAEEACFDATIRAEEFAEAERLQTQVVEITQDVLTQIYWPFWQSSHPLPSILLRSKVQQWIDSMRLLPNTQA